MLNRLELGDTQASADRTIQRILDYLCCPDDRSKLHAQDELVVCSKCGRQFNVTRGSTVDILPYAPTQLLRTRNRAYVEAYLNLFNKPLSSGENGVPWGADEKSTSAWAEKRMRQVRHVLPIVLRNRGKTLCDLSVGAGRYTLEYAKYFDLVVQCDLSPESVSYVSRKAEVLGLSNVVSLRTDYLQLPFDRSLDVVLCLDSLEGGEEHEHLLLHSIQSSLAPGGIAIIDFHNWWHNPFRRLGLLKQNLKNQSYSRRKAEAMLRNVGICRFEYVPFVQEVSDDRTNKSFALKLLPATRLIYVFQAGR
jgi:SAM-dependent methyltransferase